MKKGEGMTNEEILKKALEKAVKGGWKIINQYDFNSNDFYDGEKAKVHVITFLINSYRYKDWIFSHDFAKAFWGDAEICGTCGGKDMGRGVCCYCNDYTWTSEWKYHLQQMVLEPEPLQYLRRFI